MTHLVPSPVYNLLIGLFSSVGIGYLLYVQLSRIEYRRFLYVLGAGFLLFSIGGPLAGLLAPDWIHLVHGIAALLVVFGLYDPIHNDLRTEEWVELLFKEPNQVRHPRAWMRPIDEQILELFRSADLVLTPAIVAYNIDYSTKEVNRRLSVLTDHGFVERIERGKYQLTEIGEQYLQISLDTDRSGPQTAINDAPGGDLTDW